MLHNNEFKKLKPMLRKLFQEQDFQDILRVIFAALEPGIPGPTRLKLIEPLSDVNLIFLKILLVNSLKMSLTNLSKIRSRKSLNLLKTRRKHNLNIQ
jgi:hypothetical protein